MSIHKGNPSGAPLIGDFELKGTTNVLQANVSTNPLEPSTAASGSSGTRKRGRDIHGLERFKQVVFGERGFPQLQAMVARNPILMYPPPGIEGARQRRLEAKCAGEEAGVKSSVIQEKTDAAHQKGDDDKAEETLQNYHHKQLDVFLHLLYEFNHMTFVKLPMNDTLQLLSRCGREAVAHVTEYEMHQRLKRSTWLRELRVSHEERHRLRSQFMELEDLQAQAELERAEAAHRELELLDFNHIDGSDGQPMCDPLLGINRFEEKESGFTNISPSGEISREVDAINALPPALEENMGNGRVKHDPSDLEAENEPTLERSCEASRPGIDPLS